jgi:predicted ester cyclase
VVNRLIDAIKDNDPGAMRSAMSSTWSGHSGSQLVELDYFIGANEMINSIGPFGYEIVHQIGEGPIVATMLIWTGRHIGEFQGMAPAGNVVTFSVVRLDRVEDARVAET